ncbi:MAG TPA: tetratricopeptide repeat protein [bacterium]|nr:tetratricopeptide repeat protein [bacterium]
MPILLLCLAALGAPLAADDCADLFQQGHLARAEACLREQARQHGDQAGVWFQLGLARAARGNYRGAADAQRLAVSHAPDFGQAYCALALALRESSQFTEGLGAAEAAVRLLPDYAGAWNLRGNLLLDNARRDDAEASYRQALVLRPDYPGAWFNLGQLMERGRRWDEARDAYDAALRLRPGFAEALVARAELALKRNGLDEAENDFMALTESADWKPEGYWGLERVAAKRGLARRARSWRLRYKGAVAGRDRRLDESRHLGLEEPQPFEPGLPMPPGVAGLALGPT